VGIIREAYERKASMEHAEALRGLERYVILNAVDRLWQEHLYAMDGLREAVYLRAFAQKDPLVEYKNEAFAMFSELMDNIKFEVLNNLFRSTTNLAAFEQMLGGMTLNTGGGNAPENSPSKSAPGTPMQDALKMEMPKRELPRVGRNDPCPCGSGKKFKSCCGRTA
jgi:preprotein translocase subunit SecA